VQNEIGSMSVREAGAKGGRKLLERYGAKHFRELGKLGGAKVAEQRANTDFYQRIGKLGGDAVKARLGRDWYSRIGKLGGEKLRDTQGPDYYSRIGKMGGRGKGPRASTAGCTAEAVALGAELRGLREAAGLRQADIAAHVGCTTGLVSQVECGRRAATAKWRKRYATVLALRK